MALKFRLMHFFCNSKTAFLERCRSSAARRVWQKLGATYKCRLCFPFNGSCVGKPEPPLCLFLLPQSQQKEMQIILKNLSQQDERSKECRQGLGQQLNVEVQKQSCIIEQLKQTVAEREARVQELEEKIQQLMTQVSQIRGAARGLVDLDIKNERVPLTPFPRTMPIQGVSSKDELVQEAEPFNESIMSSRLGSVEEGGQQVLGTIPTILSSRFSTGW